MPDIRIFGYEEKHAKQVKQLVISVHEEFGFAYDYELDYDLDQIACVYLKSNGGFWVAVKGQRVIGCVALKVENDEIAMLKRMYISQATGGRG